MTTSQDPNIQQGQYPQSYSPPQQWAPVQQPKKKMSTGLKVTLAILGTTLLLCGGGFVACSALVGKAANDISVQQEAKVSHVTLAPNGCNIESADSDLFPNVKVDLVVNNTGKNQETYFIDVFVFNSKNERVGNSTAVISDVRPGTTVKETEYVGLTKQVSGKISCKIDKVS